MVRRTRRRAKGLRLSLGTHAGIAIVALRKRRGRRTGFKGDRIRPRRDRFDDLYCIYEWRQTRVDGPNLVEPVPDGYGLPDFDICIYCSDPNKLRCPPRLSVTPWPGIWWDLVIGPRRQCTHCIEGPHFERVVPAPLSARRRRV